MDKAKELKMKNNLEMPPKKNGRCYDIKSLWCYTSWCFRFYGLFYRSREWLSLYVVDSVVEIAAPYVGTPPGSPKQEDQIADLAEN